MISSLYSDGPGGHLYEKVFFLPNIFSVEVLRHDIARLVSSSIKFGHCLPCIAILGTPCVLLQNVWPLPSVHRDFGYPLCTSATRLAAARPGKFWHCT